MRRVLVTGSRDWLWSNTVLDALRAQAATDETVVVVHGGATGADSYASSVAKWLGLQEEIHPANWKHSGKQAGLLRNTHMVNLGADVCLAFIRNNSRGATDCARKAEEAGIPVHYFRWDD